jgi:hypothetical protein
MHEYWGHCGRCQRAYVCQSSGVPGSLPTDFRCTRCGSPPERLEIRLDSPTGYAAVSERTPPSHVTLPAESRFSR